MHPLQTSDLERIETPDGSHTWLQTSTGVTYRSIHGARTESETVFLHGARLPTRPSPWRVLEFGFGVGTNFQTTALAAQHANVTLQYTTVDFAPIPPDLIDPSSPFAPMLRDLVQRARAASSPNTFTHTTDAITCTLLTHDWLDAPLDHLEFDAVYFDPFGPNDNPNAWTTAHFQRAADHMTPHAILATYSAAGRVRRAMFAAGLSIATAPGPGKKREISLAATSTAALHDYDIIKKYNHDLKG